MTAPTPWGVLTTTFRGAAVTLQQEPLSARTGDGSGDTTGRIVWECSSVLLRWLEHDANLARLSCATPLLSALRAMDLSAGAGLLALSLSAAGCTRVAAAETATQLPQLSRNVAAARAGVALLEHRWGDAPESLAPPWAAAGAPSYDFATCSDVLFIALRDGVAAELAATLRVLARAVAGGILFGFEERLVREEGAFMAALSEGGALRVEELPHGDTVLAREHALQDEGIAHSDA
jgi:hypothetical protein